MENKNIISRTEIINLLIEKHKFESYLEIGVRVPAENFDKINVKIKHSVDPDPKGNCTYIMTSNEFFENYVNSQQYDVIFVDGLHTNEQVYLDVINSIKHLTEGGFIVIHDCNPPSEYHIRSYENYLKSRGQWNGTVFRGFIRLKLELKKWNCFVVDEDFGCGIITKRELNKKYLPLKTVVDEISWEYFNKYKKILLDLITFKEYKSLIDY